MKKFSKFMLAGLMIPTLVGSGTVQAGFFNKAKIKAAAYAAGSLACGVVALGSVDMAQACAFSGTPAISTGYVVCFLPVARETAGLAGPLIVAASYGLPLLCGLTLANTAPLGTVLGVDGSIGVMSTALGALFGYFSYKLGKAAGNSWNAQ